MVTVEPKITYIVGDDLIAGVVAAAIWSEKRRFGLSQDMLRALNRKLKSRSRQSSMENRGGKKPPLERRWHPRSG